LVSATTTKQTVRPWANSRLRRPSTRPTSSITTAAATTTMTTSDHSTDDAARLSRHISEAYMSSLRFPQYDPASITA
jgi:hypothetical protein